MRSINQKMTGSIIYEFRNFIVRIYPKTSKHKGRQCACCDEIKIKAIIVDKNPHGEKYIYTHLCKECTGRYSLHLKHCKKRRMGFALLKMKGII